MSEEKKYNDADWVKARLDDIFRRLCDARCNFVEASRENQSTQEHEVEMRRCGAELHDLRTKTDPDLLQRCSDELNYSTSCGEDGKQSRTKRRRRVLRRRHAKK